MYFWNIMSPTILLKTEQNIIKNNVQKTMNITNFKKNLISVQKNVQINFGTETYKTTINTVSIHKIVHHYRVINYMYNILNNVFKIVMKRNKIQNQNINKNKCANQNVPMIMHKFNNLIYHIYVV